MLWKVITILFFCFSIYAETQKKSFYLFLLEDKELLNDSFESFDPKVFCPKGSLMERIGYKSQLESDVHYYYLVKCNSIKGYIDTDYKTISKIGNEWLVKNKEKILHLLEFRKEMSGLYENPDKNLEFKIWVDTEKLKIEIYFLPAVKHLKSWDTLFDYRKLSINEYELTNPNVKLILKKEGNGFYLKV
ncbi:MAG TPA: hypothetical protein PLG41_24010, partial [Leptospiraceae bacterium]|nr:hypothetical protein [Leptospiraceae bacterium]